MGMVTCPDRTVRPLMPPMPIPRRRPTRPRGPTGHLPDWVTPQLTKLVANAPEAEDWAHEIKRDGYRMHARIAAGTVLLLTRTGLDWTNKYTLTAAALKQLPVREAYIDGELCAVGADGVTSFSLLQAASDNRTTATLVYFAFDLLYVDGKNLMTVLIERKRRLRSLLQKTGRAIQFADHQLGKGPLCLSASLPHEARRHRVKADRRTVPARRSRLLRQDQVSQIGKSLRARLAS